MNRRDVLQALAAVLPATAAVNIEPEVKASDLIIIRVDATLDECEYKNFNTAIKAVFPDQNSRPVILLVDGTVSEVRVERGIAKAVIEHSVETIDYDALARRVAEYIRTNHFRTPTGTWVP